MDAEIWTRYLYHSAAVVEIPVQLDLFMKLPQAWIMDLLLRNETY